MNKEELFLLLRNYGVTMSGDIMDYEEEDLRASTVELKKKAEEAAKKIKEAEKPEDPLPEVKEEEKKAPELTLQGMGYNDKNEALRAINSIRSAQRDLDKQKMEMDDKVEEMKREAEKMEARNATIELKAIKLAEDYKKLQIMHDTVQLAKHG